jgi:hypothetical protein
LSRKEERAKKRQAKKARQDLIQYLSATLFVAGLVGVLLALLGEPKLSLAAVVAIACLSPSFKYPRQALYGLIIYVPFGGTVVYALGGSGILQLAKDAIYIPALIGVIQFCRRTQQPLIIPPLIKMPLLVLLGSSGLTLLVVNGGQQREATGGEVPILIGVLGLKVLIGYVLIIPCIYYLLRDREDVYFLLRL